MDVVFFTYMYYHAYIFIVEIVRVLLGFTNQNFYTEGFWSMLQMHLVRAEMFTPMVFGLCMRVEGLHNYMDTSLGLCVKCHLELPHIS
jgi:hypothetical protein